jgi:transposase
MNNKKRKRWPRDEALYNLVQENEFENFFDFVRYLSNVVCESSKMKNNITCLLIWHKFPNLSARRAKSFLRFLKRFKIINANIPCFKTLCNYRAEPIIGNILDELITESSKPLAKIEHDFATDATGIRTNLFSSWYSIRCQRKIRKRDHLTIHITTGVKSNIVTALNVETKSGNDNKIFREHVDKTSENFKINEFSGDGKYWCKDNCRKVFEAGAKPYFKVWKNWSGKSRGCMPWKIMNLESKNNPKEYGKHYHKRSNVESTNHSKKIIHGNKVYSRLKSSRINEETLRWINHNINVLNRAKYEWDINPLSED